MQLFTTSARNRLHALAPRAANFNLTENGDIFLSSLFFLWANSAESAPAERNRHTGQLQRRHIDGRNRQMTIASDEHIWWGHLYTSKLMHMEINTNVCNQKCSGIFSREIQIWLDGGPESLCRGGVTADFAVVETNPGCIDTIHKLAGDGKLSYIEQLKLQFWLENSIKKKN